MQIILTLTVGILLYLSGAFLARYLRFLINISAKRHTGTHYLRSTWTTSRLPRLLCLTRLHLT